MYVGIPNPHISVPLEKMTLEPEDDSAFEVLYNPESLTLSRKVQYAEEESLGGLIVGAQFTRSRLETLSFRLFFDSMSSGSEVGGSVIDKAIFAGNSLLPSITKLIDVRPYIEKVTKLMLVHEDLHVPPRVEIKWSSLQFVGYLVNCKQQFVKFNERGVPVRAWLDCVFQEATSPLVDKLGNIRSLNSPDTTKFHTVCQGESLWSLSTQAYGQPEQWRLIADANEINNPRRLLSGEVLRMPALKK